MQYQQAIESILSDSNVNGKKVAGYDSRLAIDGKSYFYGRTADIYVPFD